MTGSTAIVLACLVAALVLAVFEALRSVTSACQFISEHLGEARCESVRPSRLPGEGGSEVASGPGQHLHGSSVASALSSPPPARCTGHPVWPALPLFGRWWFRAGLVAVVIAAFAGLLAPLAGATVYSPPTTPFTEPSFNSEGPECSLGTAGTHTSEVGQELFLLRGQSVSMCETSFFATKTAAFRLFWLTEEVLRSREKIEALHSDDVVLREKLESVHNDLSSSGAVFGELKLIYESLGTSGQLHADLTAAAGVPVKLEGQKSSVEVNGGIAGMLVSNQPSLTSLESATASGNEATEVDTEVVNRGIWILVGALIASIAVAVLWRVLHGR